jgi:hypothetical protein
MNRSLACSAALALFAATAEAQERPRELRPPDPGAFVIEAAGGALGSLAGIGVVAGVSDCDVEDLGCLLKTVGAGGLLGVVGATIGTTIAAKQTGAPRSVGGAALGAVVGTGAGLGVHWLLNRASDRNLGDWVVVPIFTITQGTFAGLGSRLFGGR